MRIPFAIITALIPYFSYAQNDLLYIAPFKNDADGAYTLIHDDFGGQWAHGIADFADTIAFNRGIPFCFAAIGNECDATDWDVAKAMIGHGHQIVNHSMYHKCGKEKEWCTNGTWDEHDFVTEIDKTTKNIEKFTGKHPAFFMFPYDLHTDTMVTYLQNKGYCGTRAGKWDLAFPYKDLDPFYLNFKAHAPGQQLSDLNSFATEAVTKKGWAVKEVHGVSDESWVAIPMADYQSHMNFLKDLSSKNTLWVGTLSDVLLYTLLRTAYIPRGLKKDPNQRITEFELILANPSVKTPSKVYERALSTTNLRELSVVIVQPKSTLADATQQQKKVTFFQSGDKIIVQANPWNGPVTLTYKP